MFKLVAVFSALVAFAQGGALLHSAAVGPAPAISYAAGPALGAPLLGRVTYNAPETTIVKQPVVVDQPEVHVRTVQRVVDTAPIVKTSVAAPIVKTHVAPAPVLAAAPVAYAAPAIPAFRTIAAAPALAYNYNALPLPNFGYAAAW